ncbi:amidohydrolase family protein [Candidatus Sumerlaeota bacterium]|nr:amidohydrolase family protein [Candidatus Sumerlaeota bacterium]
MSEQSTIFRARKIYREDGTLLDDGAVVCRAGKIAAVAPWPALRSWHGRIVNLGPALLLPGLVNAHTHLRLTHLLGKIASTADFVGWLARITLRAKFTRQATFLRSIEAGARRLLEGGVTTAVEIDVDGLSAETLRSSPLRLVFAHECIALDPARAEQTLRRLTDLVERLDSEPLRREHGLAPHAPYSVSRELWQLLSRKTREAGHSSRLITTHLAESAEEVAMFRSGRGKMIRWLRMFGVLPRGWRAPRCSPVEFLEQTGTPDARGIAAHCGFADEADAERLARHGWTVAFCPGTHEYFKRPAYPLHLFRRAGVPVCVATDSAASNTGLGMMNEMARLARHAPDLSAKEIVAAATTIPARAIGWGDNVGRIEIGYCADFSAWTPCCEGNRLDRSWFATPPACAAIIIGGRTVMHNKNL